MLYYSRVIFPKSVHHEGFVRVRHVDSVGRIFLGKPTWYMAAKPKAIYSSGKTHHQNRAQTIVVGW